MTETCGEGLKFDQGKLRLGLIPPELKRELGRVLTHGASKYDDRNWEKGMDWLRAHDALERHLLAWQEGESYDPESKCHHLASVIANAMFLMVWEMRGVGNDNVHINRDRRQEGDVQRREEDRPETLRVGFGRPGSDDLVWKIRPLGEFPGFEGKFGEVWSHFHPDVQS